MKSIIDLTPKKQKAITPKEYLALSPREKNNVEVCRFIPPTIGGASFGAFVVTLKQPVYVFEHGETK